MNNQTQNLNENSNKTPNSNVTNFLWIIAGILFIGLIIARIVFPEYVWLSIAVGLPLIATLVALIAQNQKALKSRSAAFGLNSTITIALVIGIVGVLNFLAAKYPAKWDLTTNKKHTLSEQSIKIIKGVSKTVKATVFTSQRDRFRPILDNYKAANPKLDIEYVDPYREPIRVKTAGIKKPDTLLLTVGNREERIDNITEEKITNALIKLLKEKSPVLCSVIGHGEKSFNGTDADGYDGAKKALVAQYYEVKEVNLLQDAKLNETCDALAILGPTKPYFEPEVKNLKNYLDNGGRAIIALDLNLRGSEYTPELVSLLGHWQIKPLNLLVVDPFSKAFGLDASVALAPQNAFSRENAISKDFQATAIFPIARPLVEDKATAQNESLKVDWVARTSSEAFASTVENGAVRVDPSKDKKGPYNLLMSVDGKLKDSKASKNTRLVVLSTSLLATNQFARMGGNLDLFVNSVSWAMEDENLISIRAKEDVAGKVEMSQKAGSFIALLTIFIIPLLIGAGGLSVWLYRRKL